MRGASRVVGTARRAFVDTPANRRGTRAVSPAVVAEVAACLNHFADHVGRLIAAVGRSHT
eukprot:14830817-Alexandrium_andersonii.AAC.1